MASGRTRGSGGGGRPQPQRGPDVQRSLHLFAVEPGQEHLDGRFGLAIRMQVQRRDRRVAFARLDAVDPGRDQQVTRYPAAMGLRGPQGPADEPGGHDEDGVGWLRTVKQAPGGLKGALFPRLHGHRHDQPWRAVSADPRGADAQPQVLLQLLARMFACGQDPGEAIAAPRWVLSQEPTTYFDIWQLEDPPLVRLEHDAPRSWAAGLRARGYEVVGSAPGDQVFGHAQMISVLPDGMLAGAADPRSGDGAFAGWLGHRGPRDRRKPRVSWHLMKPSDSYRFRAGTLPAR
jgi:hypothetical protein